MTMKYLLILLFLPLLVHAKTIDMKVHQLANEAVLLAIGDDDHAIEYATARIYHTAFINDDLARDYVVFHSVIGYNRGNNHTIFASIILSDKDDYKLLNWFKIGAKFWEIDMNFMEIENGYLKTRRMKYLQNEPDDPEFIYFDMKSGKQIDEPKQ